MPSVITPNKFTTYAAPARNKPGTPTIPKNVVLYGGIPVTHQGIYVTHPGGAPMELFAILSKASIRLSAPKDQTFNDTTFERIDVWDTITVERGLTVDPVTFALKTAEAASYIAVIGIDGDFGTAEEMAVAIYVNGVPYSTNPAALQGRGNGKPVAITWQSTANLNAGDIVDVRLKNTASGSLPIHFRRLYFSLRKDS